MLRPVPKSPTIDVFPIFRTQHQADLLRLLLLQPDRKFTGVELAELTGRPASTTYPELRRLVSAGIIREEEVATAKYSQAATNSPFYEHLRALVQLAMGPEAELRARLSTIDGIDVAVIFGSWARGTDLHPTSDVDVLVVGTPAYEQLADAASEVEALIGRDVQIISYSWEELDQRIASDSGFVKNVLNGPIKALLGEVQTLRERGAA